MTSESLAFHRWIDPAGRSAGMGAQKIDIAEPDRAVIAAWLGIPALPALTARLDISRDGGAEAAVEGVIHADAELVCSISLDNFVQHLDVPVKAIFRRAPGSHVKSGDSPVEAAELDLEDDEPREWGPHGIDLGALIAEELSLALPDFPRKPGAELPEDEETAASEPRINPFDVLKKLKDQP